MNVERSVPSASITIRSMRRGDARLVASWIVQGRRMGVFRPGAGPTAASLLSHQASIRTATRSYECVIAELRGRPVGYCDMSWRVGLGEILGIFVVGQRRGESIGSHLLRYAVAALRERGCKLVRTETYEGNRPARMVLARAGFDRVGSARRAQDPKRVWLFERAIAPFPRLGALATRYGALRGENLYLQHVAIAEALVDVIKHQPNVDIILGLGSIGRGFGDEWSDIDIAILGNGSARKAFWRGERWLAGVCVDVFVVDLEVAPPSVWDSNRKQAFEEGVILYSRNERSQQSLKRALRLRRVERQTAVVDVLFKLGWLGFAPRSWFMKKRYGYLWSLPPDEWLRRGCVASAHATVERVVDMFLELLFLVNGLRIPDPKWRRFLVTGLAWQPIRLEQRLTRIESAAPDRPGYRAKVAVVLGLIEETVTRLERLGLLAGDLYSELLRSSPDYDPRS